MNRILLMIGIASLMCGCAGHAWKWGGGTAAGVVQDAFATTQPASHRANGGDAAIWRPVPVSIRVYPSSRFAQENGQMVFEARVELLDAMGDPVKAPGQFDIALEGAQRVGLTAVDKALYRWQVEIRTLADQKARYDAVTQTYLFSLKLKELAAPHDSVVVKVMYKGFPGEDGKVLEDKLTVGVK